MEYIKTVGELIETLKTLNPDSQICAMSRTKSKGAVGVFHFENALWRELDESGVILFLEPANLREGK